MMLFGAYDRVYKILIRDMTNMHVLPTRAKNWFFFMDDDLTTTMEPKGGDL